MPNTREWALVAFTLLMQASVGILLVVAAVQPSVPRAPFHGSGRAFDLPLALAACTAVVALLASLAHLGHPTQAWLAVANVRSSWLSREILLALLFTAVVSAIVVARALGGSPVLIKSLSALALVAGVSCLFAMSRLYMVPAQPAWNRLATPAGFLTTPIVLGVALSVALTAYEPADAALAGFPVRWPLAVAIAALAVQLVLLPAQMSALVHEPAAAISIGSVGPVAGWLAAARAVMILVAIALLLAATRTLPHASPAMLIVTVALVLASEMVGRLLFYAATVRLGPV